MRIPADGGDNWFDRGWAQDTTAVPATYSVPEYSDRTCEAYYSVFQIYHLETVLSAFTPRVELDSYVDRDDSTPIDWAAAGAKWVDWAKKEVEGFRTHEYRRVVALLCQYVSNRYYPCARSDMRTARHHSGSYEAQDWNPLEAADYYALTPEKLRHAFEEWRSRRPVATPSSVGTNWCSSSLWTIGIG